MCLYNIHKSIVDDKVFDRFMIQRGTNLFAHSSNSNFIDDFISASYVLCPDFIEISGFIFVMDFFQATGNEAFKTLELLKTQFNNDRKLIEQWVNSWSFGDFFIGKNCSSMDNEIIIKTFGDILVYNWKRRVNELFPTKNIVVEYGEEIMGEAGLTITLYQI